MLEQQFKILLIDFGTSFTKVGYGGESEPVKILKTPSLINLEEFFKDKSENKNILSFLNTSHNKNLEIEEFANKIINDVLQIYKPDPKNILNCYILFNLDLKENFHDIFTAFIKYIFESFTFITSIKILPKNIFPVFVSGFYSGIILNCGYSFSTITVVNNGLCVFKKNIGYSSIVLQKMLYNKIINDVESGKNGNKLDEKNLELLKKNLIKYIDDIMVRITYILNRKVSLEYRNIINSKEEQKENIIKLWFYDDLPKIKIGEWTRVLIGEKIFGENDENNFAYIVLKTLDENLPCEIRRKIGSNIILSGGLTMLDGFYQRFNDEINFIIDNNNKFLKLKGIRKDLRVHKIIYPRNILAWVGASLLFGSNKNSFPRNEVNREEKEIEEGKKIVSKKIDIDELNKIFDNLKI